MVRGIRSEDLTQHHRRSPATSAGHARRLRRRAGACDRPPPCRHAVAARRRQHHHRRAAGGGDADGHDCRAPKPIASRRCSRSACPNTTRASCSCRLPRRRPTSTGRTTSRAIEVYTTDPGQDGRVPQERDRGGRPADLPGGLAAAQRDVLQRAAGRAQRHVPDPDADRAGRGAEHHLRPDHAGEGQGPRHRHPAHHGRLARLDHAHLPDHRRLDRRGRHRSSVSWSARSSA